MYSNSFDLIESWGLNLDKNEDLLEQLENRYTEKSFALDIYPEIISSKDKFQYVELGMPWVKNPRFAYEQNKYIQLMKWLWLYNETYADVGFTESYACRRFVRRHAMNHKNYLVTDKIKKKNIKAPLLENQLCKIENVDEVKILVSTGLSEWGYHTFFFQEYKIIIILHGFTNYMFLMDDDSKSKIEPLIPRAGLFLRTWILTK